MGNAKVRTVSTPPIPVQVVNNTPGTTLNVAGANRDVAATGPHGDTTRWTYTVPANKRAYMSSLYLKVVRITVAGTPLNAMAYISVNGLIARALLTSVDNAIGNRDTVNLSTDIWLDAGDVLTGHTSDAGTTGTVQYALEANVQEYSV